MMNLFHKFILQIHLRIINFGTIKFCVIVMSLHVCNWIQAQFMYVSNLTFDFSSKVKTYIIIRGLLHVVTIYYQRL